MTLHTAYTSIRRSMKLLVRLLIAWRVLAHCLRYWVDSTGGNINYPMTH